MGLADRIGSRRNLGSGKERRKEPGREGDAWAWQSGSCQPPSHRVGHKIKEREKRPEAKGR